MVSVCLSEAWSVSVCVCMCVCVYVCVCVCVCVCVLVQTAVHAVMNTTTSLKRLQGIFVKEKSAEIVSCTLLVCC